MQEPTRIADEEPGSHDGERLAGGGGLVAGGCAAGDGLDAFPEWLAPVPASLRSEQQAKEARKRVAKVKRALYNAAYYAAHADELRARRRERYAADPESAMERITAWRIKNPEVWREISARSSRAYRLRRKQRSGA